MILQLLWCGVVAILTIVGLLLAAILRLLLRLMFVHVRARFLYRKLPQHPHLLPVLTQVKDVNALAGVVRREDGTFPALWHGRIMFPDLTKPTVCISSPVLAKQALSLP